MCIINMCMYFFNCLFLKSLTTINCDNCTKNKRKYNLYMYKTCFFEQYGQSVFFVATHHFSNLEQDSIIKT